MYIRSVIDVPHVPTMICTKAFLGILDRVRVIMMLREVESWAVGEREREREENGREGGRKRVGESEEGREWERVRKEKSGIEKRVRKRRRWREEVI